MKTTAILFLAAGAAFAQTPRFEAISIKPAAPPDMHMIRTAMNGGPGTPDPGLFKCEGCSLKTLVMNAFNIKPFQLTGPAWLNDERFDISARVPKDATKAEFREMQVNLLTDRFGLTFHRETKEVPAYDLLVAKGGMKLKESVAAAETTQGRGDVMAGGAPALGKDGFPDFPMTDHLAMIMMNGRSRAQGSNQSAEQIATLLSNQLGRPVTNATGLTGKYDVKLSWASDNMNVGPVSPNDDVALPALITAIQEQMGLRLDSKKSSVETILIDRIQKVPSEN